MESSMVIKLDVVVYISGYVVDCLVFVQIDSLNFGASPEALNADVICCPAFTIH